MVTLNEFQSKHFMIWAWASGVALTPFKTVVWQKRPYDPAGLRDWCTNNFFDGIPLNEWDVVGQPGGH